MEFFATSSILTAARPSAVWPVTTRRISMILPYQAILDRMTFSERKDLLSDAAMLDEITDLVVQDVIRSVNQCLD
jgi:hypothetical protein